MSDKVLSNGLKSLGWSDDLVNFFFSSANVVDQVSIHDPVFTSVNSDIYETTDITFEVNPDTSITGVAIIKSSAEKERKRQGSGEAHLSSE